MRLLRRWTSPTKFADQWQRVLGIGLTGAFFCTRAAAKPMIAQGRGVIVKLALSGRGSARSFRHLAGFHCPPPNPESTDPALLWVPCGAFSRLVCPVVRMHTDRREPVLGLVVGGDDEALGFGEAVSDPRTN